MENKCGKLEICRFIFEIIAALGVITAIVYGIIAIENGTDNLRIAEENLEISRGQTRPYIVITPHPKGTINKERNKLSNFRFHLMLMNKGKGPAHNVKFRVYGIFESEKNKSEKSPKLEFQRKTYSQPIAFPGCDEFYYMYFPDDLSNSWFNDSSVKFYLYCVSDYTSNDETKEYFYAGKYLIDQNPNEKDIEKIIAVLTLKEELKKGSLYKEIINEFENQDALNML